MTPTEFFLFPNLRKIQTGKSFGSNEGVLIVVDGMVVVKARYLNLWTGQKQNFHYTLCSFYYRSGLYGV